MTVTGLTNLAMNVTYAAVDTLRLYADKALSLVVRCYSYRYNYCMRPALVTILTAAYICTGVFV